MPLLSWLARARAPDAEIRRRPAVRRVGHRLAVPVPGAREGAPTPAGGVPPATAYRWPFRDVDGGPLPNRGVAAPVALEEFKREAARWCDDVGVISIDDPAHRPRARRDPLRLPARALARLPDRRGEQGRDAVALPAERQPRALPLRGAPLRDGAPHGQVHQRARRRGAHDHDRLAAGGRASAGPTRSGRSATSSSRRRRGSASSAPAATSSTAKFGAYCLIDTVVTNLEWPTRYDAPRRLEPVPRSATSASRRVRPTRSSPTATSTSSPATTTPTATRSPASSTWSATSPEAKPRRFRKRWTDTEIAALWQAMAFKVEYRCFNCVATCPAEIETAFHGERDVRRRYLDETLKPLTHTRAVEDAAVRDRHAGGARAPTASRRASGGRRSIARSRSARGRAARVAPAHPHAERRRDDALDAAVLPARRRRDGLAFTTQFELTRPGRRRRG